MKLGEIIYKYRKDNKISMDEFARRSNLSKSYIAMLEKNFNPSTGKEIAPTIDAIEKVAKALVMDFDELISTLKDTEVELPPVPNTNANHIKAPLPNPELMRTVPIYSNISCGTGMFVEDAIVDYVTVPVSMLKNKNLDIFGMYADGESMKNAGIASGDLLIFERASTIENGEIGCFCIDNNFATCKKFYKDTLSNIITLQPANDEFAPIVVTIENMAFHVVGRLVLKISKQN